MADKSRALSQIAVLTFLLLVVCSGGASAATWRTYKTRDAFTDTENFAAQAIGRHGGGFLAKCYEGHLQFFLQIPRRIRITQSNHGLAKAVLGTVSVSSPRYRFRIGNSGIYGPAALASMGQQTIIQFHGQRYEKADLDSPTSSVIAFHNVIDAKSIILQLVAGTKLVYQMPPNTGVVDKISLIHATNHLLPLLHQCEGQQAAAQGRLKPTGEKPKNANDAAGLAQMLNLEIKHQSTAPDATKTKKRIAAYSQTPSNTSEPLSLSLIDAVREQIERNWLIPVNARDSTMVIHIRIDLNPDGTLQGMPEILDTQAMNMPGNAAFRATAQSAVRAIYESQPFKMLPANRYQEWQTIDISFSPKDMVSQ